MAANSKINRYGVNKWNKGVVYLQRGETINVNFEQFTEYEYKTEYEYTNNTKTNYSNYFEQFNKINDYYFIGKKDTAKPILDTYIYVFCKKNVMMPAELFQEIDKEKNIKILPINKQSVIDGAEYFFCLSHIKFSERRILEINRQIDDNTHTQVNKLPLIAKNCSRVKKLPLIAEIYSNYSFDEQNDVEIVTENNITVFLTDYMQFIYDEDKNKQDENVVKQKGNKYEDITIIYDKLKSRCLLSKLINAITEYDKWLNGYDEYEVDPEGKKIFLRKDLRLLNNYIWNIAKNGPPKLDWEGVKKVSAKPFLKDIDILRLLIPAAHSELKDMLFPNYNTNNPYINALASLNEEKYPNMKEKLVLKNFPTNAEAWKRKFDEKEKEYIDKINYHVITVGNWICQQSFSAMLHDYEYSDLDDVVEKGSHIFANILSVLKYPDLGKVILKKELNEALMILNEVKSHYLQQNDNIYEKNIVDIEPKHQRELLKYCSVKTNDSSYIATKFFVIRKLSIVHAKLLEPFFIAFPEKNINYSTFFEFSELNGVFSFMHGKVKIETFEKVLKPIANKNFPLVFMSIRKDALGKGYYKNITSLFQWKYHIKKQFPYEKWSDITFTKQTINDVEYIVALHPVKVKKIVEKDIIKTKKLELPQNKQKCFITTNTVSRFMYSIEVLNCLFAMDTLFNNRDGIITEINIANAISAIADLSSTIIDNAKQSIGKTTPRLVSGFLGFISGTIEAGISGYYIIKCMESSDEAMIGHGIAMGGGVGIAIGSLLIGFGAGGPIGGCLVALGIIAQIVGNLLVTVLTYNDFQNWVSHCHWGKYYLSNDIDVPRFSPFPYLEWKDNINLQLLCHFYMLYDYDLKVITCRNWIETYTYHIGSTVYNDVISYKCGQLSILIKPRLFFPESRLDYFCSISYSEFEKKGKKHSGGKIVLGGSITNMNGEMVKTDKDNYSVPLFYYNENDKRKVELLEITWYDPDCVLYIQPDINTLTFKNAFKSNHKLASPVENLREILTVGKISLSLQLDVYGNGSLMIPRGHMKKINEYTANPKEKHFNLEKHIPYKLEKEILYELQNDNDNQFNKDLLNTTTLIK